MNVGELIKKLQQLPKNMVVVIKQDRYEFSDDLSLVVGTYFPNPKEFLTVSSDDEDSANAVLFKGAK
jgi:hypothetical protein